MDSIGSSKRGKLLLKRILSRGSSSSIRPGCATKGWKSKHDTHTAYAVMGRKFFGSDRALQVHRSDFNAEMELMCLVDRQHAASSTGYKNCTRFKSHSPFFFAYRGRTSEVKCRQQLHTLNIKLIHNNEARRPCQTLTERTRCLTLHAKCPDQ